MLWTNLRNFNGFLDPWREFERINRGLPAFRAHATCEFPAVNSWVSQDDTVITTEIPGIEPEDIDISVAGRSVTLRGSRKAAELKEGESYHRRERWNGKFSKKIELPYNVETGKISAKFTKGILSITLPRAEAERPRKIEIKSG